MAPCLMKLAAGFEDHLQRPVSALPCAGSGLITMWKILVQLPYTLKDKSELFFLKQHHLAWVWGCITTTGCSWGAPAIARLCPWAGSRLAHCWGVCSACTECSIALPELLLHSPAGRAALLHILYRGASILTHPQNPCPSQPCLPFPKQHLRIYSPKLPMLLQGHGEEMKE